MHRPASLWCFEQQLRQRVWLLLRGMSLWRDEPVAQGRERRLQGRVFGCAHAPRTPMSGCLVLSGLWVSLPAAVFHLCGYEGYASPLDAVP